MPGPLLNLFIKIIFILCVSSTAFADSFTYSETPHYVSPSAATTLIFEQKLARLGFTALDQTGKGRIPILNMDQIFEKNDQVIFFKQGLKPSDAKLIGQLIPSAKGYLFHGKTTSNVNFALFFQGISQTQAEQILKRSELFTSKNYSLQFSLLPSACAADNGACDPQTSPLQSLQNVGLFIDPSAVTKIATSCAVSALQGAVSGVSNMVESTWNFTKTLFTNPEKLWHETKKTFAELKDLVSNLGPRITQFIQSMKELDPEIATEIVCSTISSIVVQALIGGGIAKGALLIGQKMLSLEKLRKSLSALSKLKRDGSANAGQIANKVVSCAR